jgi:predicted nucleic acid-binding protein
MKFLIFDAGPIISLAMNGLLDLIENLKKDFNGEFILTPSVKKEVIDNPMKLKKFKLEALKVSSLLEKGIFKLSKDYVSNDKLEAETQRIIFSTNSIIRSTKTNEKMKILHQGEASCLAFANLCNGNSLIVIDERTTRVLFESPQSLLGLMEKKLHINLTANFSDMNKLGDFNFIRSSELVFVAYKKGLIDIGKGKDVIDGLMYALKYRGTAISSRDIDVMKRMV